jgi:hypothetical protein
MTWIFEVSLKRLTFEQRVRQCRIARYRRLERSRQKLRNRSFRSAGERYHPPGSKIAAPKSFDLILDSRRELARFFRAVADSVLVHKRPVRLNFRDTETFYVPGAILLFAEIDRICSLAEINKPISIIDPIRRRPREVLKQIGFHHLTKDTCDIVPERDDVVYWKATKGATQTGDSYASLVEAVAERANRDHVKHLEVSGLWRSVSEAVANSVEHAYKRPRKDGFHGLPDTKWWMFSQIKDGFFSLAVCDLGCGYRQTINETLPERFVSLVASQFVGANRDALAIDTAMEFGRSGTHESHRGKGSRDALSLLASHGNGRLFVISNTGWMRYEYQNNVETARQNGSLYSDMGGTILWWRLPLTEVFDAKN